MKFPGLWLTALDDSKDTLECFCCRPGQRFSKCTLEDNTGHPKRSRFSLEQAVLHPIQSLVLALMYMRFGHVIDAPERWKLANFQISNFMGTRQL